MVDNTSDAMLRSSSGPTSKLVKKFEGRDQICTESRHPHHVGPQSLRSLEQQIRECEKKGQVHGW